MEIKNEMKSDSNQRDFISLFRNSAFMIQNMKIKKTALPLPPQAIAPRPERSAPASFSLAQQHLEAIYFNFGPSTDTGVITWKCNKSGI